MRAYYARRAGEYEAIYARPERQADLRTLEAALPACFSGRRVLEVACGTGWWTAHGARHAQSWLSTDANPEPLAIARTKPMPEGVQFQLADAYDLPEAEFGAGFNAAFAGFWWSHVPLQNLAQWLASLHARLQPGAQLVFIDNLFLAGNSTPISRTDAAGNTYQQRRLADGSVHEVLKNYPTPAEAATVLGARARAVRWTALQHYWMLSYELARDEPA